MLAGISVALVVIPQSLAYAELAGMPPVHGLYAAALPPLVAALIASSPYLQTGPVAITSLLTFGALSTMATPASEEYVGLGLLLALVVGAARLALGLLRAGAIAYLMSQPMLWGFIPASALLIASSQLPGALGADPPGDGVVDSAVWALAHPGSWEPAAVGLSAFALAVILGGRRVHALFPGVLIAVGLAIAFSELGSYDGETVGAIPTGLPPISLDLPWSELTTLLVPGVVIALVGFAEPASIARTFAALDRRPWSADREFASQGMANLASGISGGFPVGGSFSRSSLNRLAGARTRLSGAVTGIVVLAFLPFASALSALPRAILSAIVIGAVLNLLRFREPLGLWRYSRPQFAVAFVTFALTLALEPHVERAVMIGIGLSIAVHLWRELQVEVASESSGDELRLVPHGVLWFGAAQRLEDAFLDELTRSPGARRVTIDLSGLGRIDVTGALALRSVVREARRSGLETAVEGGPPQSRELMAAVLREAAGSEPG